MTKDIQTVPETREDILRMALDARVQEVMHYQINMDNYTLALEKIATMGADERAELAGFTEQLQALLASERFEQKKARVMLDVIRAQVEV